MDKIEKNINKGLNNSISAKKEFLSNASLRDLLTKAISEIILCLNNKGRLYIAGNGGSAADSQHLAAELVCRFKKNRAAIPAEALSVDTSIITAIGNDFSFDEIFSRQLEAKLDKNDIFLGISTSGNSKNIIKALKTSNYIGAKSIILTGRDGGDTKNLATYCICVPSQALFRNYIYV